MTCEFKLESTPQAEPRCPRSLGLTSVARVSSELIYHLVEAVVGRVAGFERAGMTAVYLERGFVSKIANFGPAAYVEFRFNL